MPGAARAEVVDDHIRCFYQPPPDALARVGLQVGAEAALVAVVLVENARAIPWFRLGLTLGKDRGAQCRLDLLASPPVVESRAQLRIVGQLSAARVVLLDFDHIGAQIAQRPADQRTGPGIAELDHANTGHHAFNHGSSRPLQPRLPS